MARRIFLFVLVGFGVGSLSGCGATTATTGAKAESGGTPANASAAKAESGKTAVASAATIPAPAVVHVDSTGQDPRPQVLVEGVDLVGVRTRLIPHVMGRGWALTVNKSDSIEFQRSADPALAQALFGLNPEPGTKILLRFRLATASDGTRIQAVSHLLGRSGALPYRASADVLVGSLEELRRDILSAPTSNGTAVDRVKGK